MKEITFLKQNEQKWTALERELSVTEKKNPKRLAEQFIELTDDLSYARTHYPNSKTTEYLNGLTARFHQEIYRNKREKSSRLWDFWLYEMPFMFYRHQKKLLISALIFVVGIAVGALVQYYDENVLRMVTSDNYVNERIEEIESDAAMSWYGDMNPFFMFTYITLNNIMVSFTFFAFGFLFAIGTGALVFYNSVTLGALVMFFKQYGYLKTCLMIILIHGTFELSTMIIEGVAGFVLGSAILYPGTLTRTQSLMKGAKDGLKITVGCLPIIVIAGFLESFITRFYHMPEWLNWIIILLSLGFMMFYFLIYPIVLNKRLNFSGVIDYKDLKIR